MFRPQLKMLLGMAFAFSIAIPAPIAQAALLSTSEMILVLREAKIVSPSVRLDVIGSDQGVTVITKRTQKATDDDCKIQAVLMAKALMDAQPKQLAAVKVIFTVDGENSISKVVVSVGDVQSFASGSITEKQLLSSLELSRESTDADNGKGAALATGPQKESRAVLQSRIAALKQGGTGVAPFQKMFNDIEELTRTGKTKEASQMINDLSTKLCEQESLRDQAKRVGEGRGVKGQQGAASADARFHQPEAGGTGQNQSSMAQTGKGFNEPLSDINSHLNTMDKMGMPTSQFRKRLEDVLRQSSTMTAEATLRSLELIKSDMKNAPEPQHPNGGWLRKRFNGQ